MSCDAIGYSPNPRAGYTSLPNPEKRCSNQGNSVRVAKSMTANMFASSSPKVKPNQQTPRRLHDYPVSPMDTSCVQLRSSDNALSDACQQTNNDTSNRVFSSPVPASTTTDKKSSAGSQIEEDEFYDCEEVSDKDFVDASDNLVIIDSEEEPFVHVNDVETSEDTELFTIVDDSLDAPMQDKLEYALLTLFSGFYRSDIADDMLSIMHPNGILGTMLEQNPEETKPIIEARIMALMADTKNWWRASNRLEAEQELIELNQQLKAGEHVKLLNGLKHFEDKHGKVPFQAIVHGRFADHPDMQCTALFEPVSRGISSWVGYGYDLPVTDSPKGSNTDQQAIMECFRADRIPVPSSWKDKKVIFNTMLEASPANIKKLLFARCHADLLSARKDFYAGQEGAEELLRVTASRLKHVPTLGSAEQLQEWLNQPQYSGLLERLESECAAICYQASFGKLMKLELSELSQEELYDLEPIISEMVATNGSLGLHEIKHQLQTKELEHLQTALRLTRFMNAEKADALSERTYMLKTPPTAHLMKKLSQISSDYETELYGKINHYLQHLAAYSKRPSYSTMVAFQQATFDLRCSQEEVVMAETRRLTTGETVSCCLTPGNYKENTQLLTEMDKALQKTTPVRPVLNSDKQAFLQIGIQHLWKGRPALCDRLAELQHQKDLKVCKYDFNKELGQFCQSVPGASEALKRTANDIITPTLDKIRAWRKGQGSAWEIITTTPDSYRKLEEAASSVLSDTLEVAQRNPKLFRRMVGDTAQSIEQLKTLIGFDNFALLAQLQARAKAESAASLFAGDDPEIEEFDYASHPEDAARLRRFQLMVDLAGMAWQGTTAANAFKTLCTTTLASQVGGAIGAVAMGIPTLGAGAGVGYNIGSHAGAAVQAACQVTGAVAVREKVNSLSGHSVRALNRMINYSPLLASTSPPADQLALFSRNVAKKRGFVRSYISTLLTPYTFRLNKLTEAVRGIRNGEPGAWSRLAVEGFKCLTIASVSAVSAIAVSAAVFYSGLLTIAMSPFLSMAIGVILTGGYISHSICTYANSLDYVATAALSGLNSYRSHLLPEGSKEALAVEAHCKNTAEKLVEKMSTQSTFKQYIRESVARELARQYWQTWQDMETDHELTAEYSAGIEKELKETQKEREELAAELEKSIQAIRLLEAHQHRVEDLEKNTRAFEAFQNKLKALGIIPPAINQGLAYYIQDQLVEIPLALTRLCGKADPGTTEEEIYHCLTEHHREVIRGSYLVTLATQGHPLKKCNDTIQLTPLRRGDLQAVKNQVVKQVHENLIQTTTDASRERVNLVLHNMLRDVVQTNPDLKPEQLDKEHIQRQAQQSLKNEKQVIQNVERLRTQGYKAALQENEIFQNMSEKQQQLIVDGRRIATGG